jgi:hypothetical protein
VADEFERESRMALISGFLQRKGFADEDDQTWTRQAEPVIAEFDVIVNELATERDVRGAEVRSRLVCDTTIFLDPATLWVLGEKGSGMGSATFFPALAERATVDAAMDAAIKDLGVDDPFVIPIPREVLDQTTEERAPVLRRVAEEWVESEVQRVIKMTQLVRINPIFGPADFIRDPNLCFVLMPFKEPLDKIYESTVKPAVEAKGLVCRRADSIRSNRVVMHDIWKSLCEARIVIAELTTRNPNVFYELGIAHTLGKETIMLAQREGERVPFDLAHIRRINYENTAPGGAQLRRELEETIDEILTRAVISTP